jgi:hypothetical protein
MRLLNPDSMALGSFNDRHSASCSAARFAALGAATFSDYERRWEGKDLTDLKRLIDLSAKLTAKTLTEMPEAEDK